MALSSQYWPRAANWQGCAVIRGWVLEMWRLAACHAATTAGQTRRGGSRRAEFYTRPRLSVAAGSRTFRFDKRSRELGRLSAVRRGTQRMLTPSQLSPQRERHALPLWPGAHSYIYIHTSYLFTFWRHGAVGMFVLHSVYCWIELDFMFVFLCISVLDSLFWSNQIKMSVLHEDTRYKEQFHSRLLLLFIIYGRLSVLNDGDTNICKKTRWFRQFKHNICVFDCLRLLTQSASFI